MKKILDFSKGNRIISLLAPLFKMLEATLELIVPLVMASIIDIGIVNNDKKHIILLCIQLIVLGLIGLIFSIIAQYFSAKSAVSIVKNIKFSAYKKCQSISIKDFDNIGSNTIITRLTSDMDGVQNGINLTLRLLLRSPFVVIGACIMAYKVEHNSIKIFATIVLLLSLIIFVIMYITIPKNKTIRFKLDEVLLKSRENITGTRVIRAFNMQEDTVNEFNNTNENFTNLQISTGKITALLNPLTMVTVNIGIAFLLYFGGVKVNMGLLTTGTVVALYNYMSQILVELVKFANLIVSITKSIACGSRIFEFLDLPDETISENIIEVNNNYIEFQNVSFTYNNGSDNSLENISLIINKSEKIGIIGATGAGKTTLINLLLGYYKPTKGKIFLEGKDITAIDNNDIRRKISVAEQKATLFKGNVLNNLSMSGNNDINELNNSINIAQAQFIYNEKDGFETIVEQNGRNFSGGQKQRISIARALSKNFEILILDDSYSALDYETEAKIRQQIDKLNKTVITISQRTGSIMNCDKIILLDNGKATVGTHKELLQNSNTYREIHFSQFEEEAKLYG